MEASKIIDADCGHFIQADKVVRTKSGHLICPECAAYDALPVLTSDEAIRIAIEIANDRVNISLHKAEPKELIKRHLHISGCLPEEARLIGNEIARNIKGSCRVVPGHAGIWF